jgi:peptidoglycan/LPS O-acetylase OafA/YrhL
LPATLACLLLVVAWGLFSRYFGHYFFEQHPDESALVPRSVLNVILVFIYGSSGKYLEDFGMGMLLALLFVYVRHPAVSSSIQATLRRLSPWIWGVGLLCLLTMILWTYNDTFPNTWPLFNAPFFFQTYYLVSELCISFAFSLCLLALLFGPVRLKQPFEWLPLRWFGNISYSVYIWHLPFLFLFIQWVQPLLRGWLPELAYPLYWLWILLLVVPFCFLFFKWVEQPGIRFGERFRARRTGVAGAAAPRPALAEPAQEAPEMAARR